MKVLGKIKMDVNGNKTMCVYVIEGKNKSPVFSIQTNGNLPLTHSNGIGAHTFNELVDYVTVSGTLHQKRFASLFNKHNITHIGTMK